MSNNPSGWTPHRGLSCNGLYFVMCELEDPKRTREFRIFWRNIGFERTERWRRSRHFDSLFEAGLHITQIANSIHIHGHANEFIEDECKKRREFVEWKLGRRDHMQRFAREKRRMTSSPTYGLF